MNLDNVQLAAREVGLWYGAQYVQCACMSTRMRAPPFPPSLSGSDYARKKGSLPLSLVLCRKEVRCSGRDGRAVMECEAGNGRGILPKESAGGGQANRAEI